MKNNLKQRIVLSDYQQSLDLLQCSAWGAGALVNIASAIFSIIIFASADWFAIVLAAIFTVLIPLSTGQVGTQMRSLPFSIAAWAFPMAFAVLYSLMYSSWFFIAVAAYAVAFVIFLLNALKYKKAR